MGGIDPKVVHINNITNILLLVETTASKLVEYFELNLPKKVELKQWVLMWQNMCLLRGKLRIAAITFFF